jgi:hypothetical protein
VDSTKSQTLNITANPISVSITSPASAQTLLSNSSALSITASTNDPKGASDLNWKLSSTSCGTLSGSSGLSVSFTPPALLTSSCSVTATAFSAYDTTQQASLSITVNPAAISVNITSPSSGSASPLEGQTLPITATISNDATAAGLAGTLSPNNCGSFGGFTLQSTSGATGTYTGTYTAPKNGACSTVLTVASNASHSATATVSIAVNAITVGISSPTGAQTMLSGASGQAITATTNDPAGANTLQWSLQGCGSISSNSGASSTYTPPAMLASQCMATVTVASSTDSSKTATLGITVNPAPITMAVTSPAGGNAAVQANGTLSVTATIYNDANSQGIGYSLNPNSCGSFSGMSKQSSSGATTTYTGTFTAPANTCSTTLTLSSNQNPSATAQISIAISGITVKLSPDGSTSIDGSSPLSLIPTVTGDPANKGVNLSLSPATGCGSLSASTAASGTSFTYNPPALSSGSCSATITAAAQSGNNITDTLSVTDYAALTLPTNLTLPTGTSGAAYSASISSSGGSGTFTWTVTGLSDGITSNAASAGSTLALSGTPTAGATVNFQVTVTDSTGSSVGPVSYSITVNQYTAVSLPSTLTLPPAYVGQSYSGTISAIGGLQPYTFTVNTTTIGSTPTTISTGDGLTGQSSGSSTLTLGGTPTTAPVTLNVTVTDAENNSASQTYTVSLAPLTFTASNLQVPQGMAGLPWQMSLTSAISGGIPPYTYTYTGLPSGVSAVSGLNGSLSNGRGASGPSAGSHTINFTVKDSESTAQSVSGSFTVNFVAAVPGYPPPNNSLLIGQYVCLLSKMYETPVNVSGSNLSLGATLMALNFSGYTSVNVGDVDSNDPQNGYKQSLPNSATSGSYAVGLDNRGTLSFGGAATRMLYALAAGDLDSSGAYAMFRLTYMDDMSAAMTYHNNHGGGVCYRQYNSDGTPVTSAGENILSSQTLSGGMVYGLNGETMSGAQAMLAGSVQLSSNSIVSGVQDGVSGSTTSFNQQVSPATGSATDSWGRIALTCNSQPCVVYITNQSSGAGLMMTTAPHNASGGDLYFGETRMQNASDIGATTPISGNTVLYMTGTDSAGSGNYKTFMMQGVGSGSSPSITVTPNASILNDAGTLTYNLSGQAMNYTLDPSTGRATPAAGMNGDVMYLWDTDSAIALFADQCSSCPAPQMMLGWLQPQVSPTAGTWVADFATQYFEGELFSGDTSSNQHVGTRTLDSNGNYTQFAQDTGGKNWGDWDEGISGLFSQTDTAVLQPDTTNDPSGAIGIFDVVVTPSGGGSSTTVSVCLAGSVDASTNSTTKGQMICTDAGGQGSSPRMDIVHE